MKMIRYIGFDQAGIRRVFGQDEFHQTALAFAKTEAEAYVRRRPDTGPLSGWTFTQEDGGEAGEDDYIGSGTSQVVTDARTGKPVTREQVEARFR